MKRLRLGAILHFIITIGHIGCLFALDEAFDAYGIKDALKRYKRKYEKTGVVKELRARQQYTKPSVIKRAQMMKAIYVQKLRQAEENM